MGFSGFGKYIFNFRKARHLSQRKFAEKLYISHQTVSKWEKGTAIPSLETLMSLSDEFNVALADIVAEIVHVAFIKTAQKDVIARTFLSLLTTDNLDELTLQLIWQSAGMALNDQSQCYNSKYEILDYIMIGIDEEVKLAIAHSDHTDPFKILAYAVLPVLYERSDELKILYSGNYANGRWLSFLEKEYHDWAEDYMNNYANVILPVSQSFAKDLVVKMTIAVISAWLVQPIPEKIETFSPKFLSLTKLSMRDIVALDSN